MFNKTLTLLAGLAIIAGMILLAGCSEDIDNSKISTVDKVIAQIADSVADQIVEAEFASVDTPTTGELVAIEDVEVDIFNDMIVVDSNLYAVFNGGVIVYDLTADTYSTIGSGEDINAIAVFNDDIYVGGKTLFKVVDTRLGEVFVGDEKLFKAVNPALEKIQVYYENGITKLESFNDELYIGTNDGLFAYDGKIVRPLRDDWKVTGLVCDNEGLWVGTDGNGLFKMRDDGSFQKRFLIRDTTIFDNVNCVDFNRGYLYVGTDDALYIHDGGSWETLTDTDGLPSANVLTVNADDWLIYVGTDKGVISYFDGDFLPVKNVDAMIANSFERWGKKMIVGTNDAVVLSSRHEQKTLVESDFIDSRQPAFVEELMDTMIPDLAEVLVPLPSIVEIDEYQTDSLDLDGSETLERILSLNDEIVEPVEVDDDMSETEIVEIKSEEGQEINQTLPPSGSGL